MLIAIGLFIKALFSHHYNYWYVVKLSTLTFFSIGLYIVSLRFFSTQKPKGGFFETFLDKILYYIASVFFLIFSLVFIMMLENIGKEANYSLRKYYLAKNTIKKQAVIVDEARLNILQTGGEGFFIVEQDNSTILKGLPIHYLKKDFGKHYEEETIEINGKVIRVKDLLGKAVIIEMSKKYSSFFRVISLGRI